MLPVNNISQMGLGPMLNLDQTSSQPSSSSTSAFESATMDPSSPSPLSGGDEQSGTQQMLLQILQSLSQLISQLMAMLTDGSEGEADTSEDASATAPPAPAPAAPAPAPATSAPAAPSASSESNATASGDTAGNAKGKEMSFDGGTLSIGSEWGGWDGVSAGELASTHDVEDRNNMIGVLKENWNMSDGETERVTTALHSASKAAGLDAHKGVHSDGQANQIKEQNHANIKNVFESVDANATAEDFVARIGEVYTGS